MSNRFVQFSQPGGPDRLEIKTEPIPEPGPDQVVIKNESIGFNFKDVNLLNGLLPLALPYRSGGEGAGTIHSIGSNVHGFKVGDRVTYLATSAYADYTKAFARRVAKLPDGISYDVAAASLLKGLTVQYLIEKIHPPERDEIVVFHAGAGGVGLIFLQWARSIGVKVITTVSTDEKAELALANGAWKVFKYSDDIPAKVRELTEGRKVKAVYDSVGKDTFDGSLDSLSPRGILIHFGSASGPVGPVNLSVFSEKGSLFYTRPMLNEYIDNMQAQTDALFAKVLDGTIKIHVNQTGKLEDIQKVFQDVIDRKTTGSSVVHP